MKIEYLGYRQFRIEGITYEILDGLDGKYDLSFEDVLATTGIKPRAFLGRLHRTRKSSYERLAPSSKMPDGEVSVKLTKGNDMSFDPIGEKGKVVVGIYKLTPNPPFHALKHEVTHEVQDTINTKLQPFEQPEWHHFYEIPNNIAALVGSLFKEGFACFIAKETGPKLSAQAIAAFKDILKKSETIELPFGLSPVITMKGLKYAIGTHMYETISKTGANIVDLALKKDPLQFVKRYERAAKRLGIKPVIDLYDIENAVPDHLKTGLAHLWNVV
jgi:hypothetical protein